MPNSNRGMFGRGNGTITVIEEPVMRSYRRKAKIVFYVTWFIVAVLAATVAASKWHPIIALLAGLAVGLRHRRHRRGHRGRLAGHPRHLVVDPRDRHHRQPDLRLDRARRAHHAHLPAGLHCRDHRHPGRLQAGPDPHQPGSYGAWSPGIASGPASRNSSSPTAPAACR